MNRSLDEADAQPPSVAAVRGLRQGDRGPRLGDGTPGLFQEDPSRFGQLYPPTRPQHEGDIQLPFQAPQQLADPRLGDMEAFGSPGEVQFLAEGDEDLEITQFHGYKENALIPP